MKTTVGVVFLLALGALGSPVNQWLSLVHDDAGNLHLVNPDPYTVIGEELEPLFTPETDVIFRLYTRANPVDGQVLQWNNTASVENSNFDPDNPTRFIVHGWNGGENSELNVNIRQNYLSVGDFNVIIVDWSAGANTINYITARNRVASVGESISKLLDWLIVAVNVDLGPVYLIGHALGAHVVGFAGRPLDPKIQTIIGLDPAGPLFSLGQSDIMGPNDAQYVEAIFSNAGTLGFDSPLGVANFYPNGGRSQPGCGIDLLGTCAQSRAHELFAESILSTVGFRATRCASYLEVMVGNCTPSGADARMGGEPSNHGRGVNGIFRFNTNSASPFAMG